MNFLCSAYVAKFVNEEEIYLIISRDCDSLNISNEFGGNRVRFKTSTWLQETFLNLERNRIKSNASSDFPKA